MALLDPRGLEGYIRETATKYGIDPDTAIKVAQSEGLANPVGDRGKSFGAFQLYTGGGLGNEFQKATGLDPSDPANERATIDYALMRASQGGWEPWHGAKRVGISPWQGIGGDQPYFPPADARAAQNAPAPAPAASTGGAPVTSETAAAQASAAGPILPQAQSFLTPPELQPLYFAPRKRVQLALLNQARR